MTLARYATVVLGSVGATLSAASPLLDVEVRPAVFAGAMLAALNTICAFHLATWSAGRSNNTFFLAVLGGMVARMAVLLLAVVLGVLLLGFPKVAFTVSLLAYFVVFLVLELAMVSRRPAGAGAR